MKGVEGFQNAGYTIMTLMRMTFGEFDVSADFVPSACVASVNNRTTNSEDEYCKLFQ